jgi:hypothetical protein
MLVETAPGWMAVLPLESIATLPVSDWMPAGAGVAATHEPELQVRTLPLSAELSEPTEAGLPATTAPEATADSCEEALGLLVKNAETFAKRSSKLDCEIAFDWFACKKEPAPTPPRLCAFVATAAYCDMGEATIGASASVLVVPLSVNDARR